MYGFDAASRRQVIGFLNEGGVMCCIWWLESIRRANSLTLIQM